MSALSWIDLLALLACAGAACALRPRAHLACRLVAVLVLGAAPVAWTLAQAAWLAGPVLPALTALAALGLINAAAAWRGVRTR